MTPKPLPDEYQVDFLSRFDRPRCGKPVLTGFLSRLPPRGPVRTRTKYTLPLQVKILVVRTWLEENNCVLI